MTTPGDGITDVVDELHRVKVRARGDRRATSAPLVVFGTLTLGYAVLGAGATGVGDFYWVLAVPGGFALVAWYYRRHEIGTGVGARPGVYRKWAVVTAVLAILVMPVFLVLGGPFVLVGLALGVIALRQRNLYLGLSAVGYGILGSLVAVDFIPNRLYDLADSLGLNRSADGYFAWAPALSASLLGLLMVTAGLWARHREERATPIRPA